MQDEWACREPSPGTAAARPRGARPTPSWHAQHLPTDTGCAFPTSAHPSTLRLTGFGPVFKAGSPPPRQLPSPPPSPTAVFRTLERLLVPGAPVARQRRLPHARCRGDSSPRPVPGRRAATAAPLREALGPCAGTWDAPRLVAWLSAAGEPRPPSPLPPAWPEAPSPGGTPGSALHSFRTTSCFTALEKNMKKCCSLKAEIGNSGRLHSNPSRASPWSWFS